MTCLFFSRLYIFFFNEFRKWKNGSTQNVELMEVFGVKDDKVDYKFEKK